MKVFECLAPPLWEPQRVYFQGCRLYWKEENPPMDPWQVTHTCPDHSFGFSSGFPLGWVVFRVQLKGQPHLWDNLFFSSETKGMLCVSPPPSLKRHSIQSLIKFQFTDRQTRVQNANPRVSSIKQYDYMLTSLPASIPMIITIPSKPWYWQPMCLAMIKACHAEKKQNTL